jgi:plasmid stabilization system protein ParE
MTVRFRGRASAQAKAIDSWWPENRPAAPELFVDELAGAVGLLATAPEAGVPYRPRGAAGVRRLLLPKTRYHIYYRYDRENQVVGILAIRSCVGGRPPSAGQLR